MFIYFKCEHKPYRQHVIKKQNIVISEGKETK